VAARPSAAAAAARRVAGAFTFVLSRRLLFSVAVMLAL
jgi:hypothetical protein